jgi:hypothetical protein
MRHKAEAELARVSDGGGIRKAWRPRAFRTISLTLYITLEHTILGT